MKVIDLTLCRSNQRHDFLLEAPGIELLEQLSIHNIVDISSSYEIIMAGTRR
jgi:hypothetical protein